MWILFSSAGVLTSEERTSVLTNGTERSSLKADGPGTTTIGKKRSLLIKPVARRNAELAFKARKGGMEIISV